DRGPLRLEAAVAGERRRVGQLVALDRPLLEAAAAFAALLEEAPASARGPLQWRHEEALRVVADKDPDRRWRQWLRDEARRLRRAFARGGHPFEAPRGYTRMAHVSVLDGSAQPYELFVPPAYRGRRAWPLVITLHGYKGNAGDYFRNTFGLARDWRGGESLLDHGRHGTAPTEGPMIVLAPQARGKSHYRHVGEVDVLEALADVRARYRVDPRRIYITGGSMGGTAAAYLPFRHPDLFAASAALAGYHDQRVRQDTHHPGLSEVERFLVAHRSDVDWSENALHLPMLLVRGTRDRPLAWTRVQAARLRELGYDVEHREPELGHNVWTETYAEGAIFDWFARHRRPERPRRVVLRTARERTNEAYWVRVDGRAEADAFAEVRAAIEGGRVVVETEAVAGLTLSPTPPLVPEGPLRVSIDGQALEGPAPLSLHREGERWALGALELAGRKRAGVSGPIRDVYHEPLVFVVGTQDPAHTFTNRQVARHWARVPGWDVRYPIVDDVDVTAEMIADKTLVLVGPPWSNALHARWRRQLPIRFDLGGPGGAGRAVLVGEARHAGDEVGTVFVAPNPDVPARSVLVIAGLGPLGTWRARFLPDLLPDWVVFDERVELARGQWSCGGARRDDGSPNFAEPVDCAYRDHGLFGMGWELRE
ncbi:MAG TPA: PHB depolymerase family esterase, partial [Polyangiaceae bacterium LLY-WYZ-15_(1-7)]|nr:PHB depolymerase family esterase [Polyangiaceae bacterium LLY-WYZ-15_(1-7)]